MATLRAGSCRSFQYPDRSRRVTDTDTGSALTNSTANALAEAVRRLRGEDTALLAREHLTRQVPTSPDRAALLHTLKHDRIAAQNRLAAAVAALETLRLDLMRLDAATPSRGGLTTQLSAVRDLARRVDAASELRAYLAGSTLTPV